MKHHKKRSPAHKTGKPASRHPRGRSPAKQDRLHLYGLHTVNAALANSKRKKTGLVATQNALARLDKNLVDKAQIPVEIVSTHALVKLVGPEAVHQGVVLECEPLDSLDASELFHLADETLILGLDQITDPHNVGAILRSAVAMGVKTVLMTSRNSASETAVLAKTASGALDYARIVHLRNFSKGLEELNEMGFATIGLDSEGPQKLEDTLSDTANRPICLVLGAEGKGLREKTRATCSALARLDMPGPIKSLNVSNAAALTLYIATRK